MLSARFKQAFFSGEGQPPKEKNGSLNLEWMQSLAQRNCQRHPLRVEAAQ
eukprot:m.116782 g.116782  ORF g.116782 m.116782 type:complete len:50 (+) comp19444_c0_seq1:2573-2722(+)